MSSYNGAENIERQIKSIIFQKNVEIHIDIRDDGSSIETINLLKKLEKKYKNYLTVYYGKNIGWKKSFLKLVEKSELKYDYYGFSDQDDIWFDNKIIDSINLMEQDNELVPKLTHCNSLSVDKNLNILKEQENKRKEPKNHLNAFVTESFQGCSMLWNNNAMKLIKKSKNIDESIPHDYWVGLIVYLFGKIYFCEECKFYHIRYEKNSSEDGNVLKGRRKRIKKLFSNENAYINPANDLLVFYNDLLTEKDKKILYKMINYKNNFFYKIYLLFNFKLSRNTILSTLFLKFSILINKY